MEIKLLNLTAVFLVFIIVEFESSEENSTTSVLMVCHTNFRRSYIAAAVFNEVAKSRGLQSQWYCDSAGLAVETPRPVDNTSQIYLLKRGILDVNRTTKKVNLTDFDTFDYMLGMDEYSVEYLQYMKYLLSFHKPPKGNKTRIELLWSHVPDGAKQFTKAPKSFTHAEYWYNLCEKSCNAFLDKFS